MDTERNAEFLDAIKRKLNPQRLHHSLCVAESARELAVQYGADPEKAYTAGLVHDIMKNTPPDDMLKFFCDNGIMLTKTQRQSPKTWHAVAGEAYLRSRLHVTDEDILTAVRYHTTGRADMTCLEKVVFIADFVSADRDYPEVEHMRATAKRSLEEAIVEGLQFTITELVEAAALVDPDSIGAYNDAVLAVQGRCQKLENRN